ncbi:hypothetical protein HO173_006236 [Letharia columbiana]|uniref:Uncharacterized protein n=1 Tax=Letharia columbiana TaxID=112416 RepID=A0A8H6FVN9_9LECA|nr:uncharacterized protein HO173_006236 [Letharia columbiana]KAF6235553.1 hypothetical protein HO173_006236 [Letharia columbiana]
MEGDSVSPLDRRQREMAQNLRLQLRKCDNPSRSLELRKWAVFYRAPETQALRVRSENNTRPTPLAHTNLLRKRRVFDFNVRGAGITYLTHSPTKSICASRVSLLIFLGYSQLDHVLRMLTVNDAVPPTWFTFRVPQVAGARMLAWLKPSSSSRLSTGSGATVARRRSHWCSGSLVERVGYSKHDDHRHRRWCLGSSVSAVSSTQYPHASRLPPHLAPHLADQQTPPKTLITRSDDNEKNYTHDELFTLQKKFLDNFIAPNNTIQAKSINSSLLADNVQGRVDITRTFDGRELNTEYLLITFRDMVYFVPSHVPRINRVLQFMDIEVASFELEPA